jgi:hypothetical protein
MSENNSQKNKVLDDLLALKHDLGKYIRLPLAMLDAEASQAEVRKALQRALIKTQKKGAKVVGAREIWESFLVEAEDSLAEVEAFLELKKTVERALNWETALTDRKITVDRTFMEDDLEAVGRAIQSVIEEVSGD